MLELALMILADVNLLQDKVYSQLPADEPSHAVNTAWALLALIAGGQVLYQMK
jgi:hypothetical protein